MKNILIIEDEETAARRLSKMILDILPHANIYPPVVSITSAIAWLQSNPSPDAMFLDVHLADGQSFEIFKQVKVTCPIIFTTAYDQYALEAFKVNSIDYLLKPIKKEELQRSIDKFTQLKAHSHQNLSIEKLLATLQQTKPEYKQRFAVKYGEHIQTIETSDIAYFYTENKVNFLVTKQNRRYALDNNLDHLETVLDPQKFFRINRQFIIGFHSITEMLTYSKSRVLVKLNPATKLETIVSAERSGAFKTWLDGG